jgi:hypothetical protein
MSDKFPLYPHLGLDGQTQAEEVAEAFLLDFKERCKGMLDELMGEFEYKIATFIETDSWENFRAELVQGICNYNNRELQGRYDYAKIRRAIFDTYKEEIIKDLDQDNLEKIAQLEETLASLRRSYDDLSRRNYY